MECLPNRKPIKCSLWMNQSLVYAWTSDLTRHAAAVVDRSIPIVSGKPADVPRKLERTRSKTPATTPWNKGFLSTRSVRPPARGSPQVSYRTCVESNNLRQGPVQQGGHGVMANYTYSMKNTRQSRRSANFYVCSSTGWTRITLNITNAFNRDACSLNLP